MIAKTLAIFLKEELEEDTELPVRIEPATEGSEYAELRAVVTAFDRTETMKCIAEWFHHILYKPETGEMLCFIPLEMRDKRKPIFFEVLVEEI